MGVVRMAKLISAGGPNSFGAATNILGADIVIDGGTIRPPDRAASLIKTSLSKHDQ